MNDMQIKFINKFVCCYDELIHVFVVIYQVPPAGKGSLYIRPLLMGTGAVLGLAPAPEYTFLVYVSPVGNYFKVFSACLLLSVKI